jgi:hypothetical protein
MISDCFDQATSTTTANTDAAQPVAADHSVPDIVAKERDGNE